MSLKLRADDGAFLVEVARRVLSNSAVAATTAERLRSHGLEPQRIDALIPWASVAVEWEGYVFKKVEPDADSPNNFGLFVRRSAAASAAQPARCAVA